MTSELHEVFMSKFFYTLYGKTFTKVLLYGSQDQRNPYSVIDAGEAFEAKLPPTGYNLDTL